MIIRKEFTWIREDEHTFCFVIPGEEEQGNLIE